MTKPAVVVFAFVVLGACGGQVAIGERSSDADAATSDVWGDEASGDEREPCRSTSGVRICGGAQAQCPELDTSACPGLGCSPAWSESSAAPAGGGVCWSDAKEVIKRSCWMCGDGEACIQRTEGELVCVPSDVCEALWGVGVRDVCRYSDKSAYDGEPIPDGPAGCPEVIADPVNPPQAKLCGGVCGGCDGPELCTGRSPRHPFGMCFASNDESPCSVTAAGVVPGCIPDSSWPNNEYCAVFDVESPDVPAAEKYGACIHYSRCLELAKLLPGGLHCYDNAGKRVDP